jgi:hypothetical protein
MISLNNVWVNINNYLRNFSQTDFILEFFLYKSYYYIYIFYKNFSFTAIMECCMPKTSQSDNNLSEETQPVTHDPSKKSLGCRILESYAYLSGMDIIPQVLNGDPVSNSRQLGAVVGSMFLAPFSTPIVLSAALGNAVENVQEGKFNAVGALSTPIGGVIGVPLFALGMGVASHYRHKKLNAKEQEYIKSLEGTAARFGEMVENQTKGQSQEQQETFAATAFIGALNKSKEELAKLDDKSLWKKCFGNATRREAKLVAGVMDKFIKDMNYDIAESNKGAQYSSHYARLSEPRKQLVEQLKGEKRGEYEKLVKEHEGLKKALHDSSATEHIKRKVVSVYRSACNLLSSCIACIIGVRKNAAQNVARTVNKGASKARESVESIVRRDSKGGGAAMAM